jgi:plasmid stabilization system protein ParE
MRLQILREAEEELVAAIAWYEEAELGLGQHFKEEVRARLLWIQKNPELPRLRSRGYRRVNLQVFPYYIAYHIWQETIWVVAIAHGHRLPEYWIERKEQP